MDFSFDQLLTGGVIASFVVILNITCIVITIPRILTVKEDPKAAIAWIFCVILLPLLGTILFFTMAEPVVQRPLRRLKNQNPIYEANQDLTEKFERRVKHLNVDGLLEKLKDSPPTIGNDAKFYTKGKNLFADISDEILKAKHEICFQYYIIENNKTGYHFVKLLATRASQGIDVYVVYDSIGCAELDQSNINYLKRNGVKVVPFLPIKIWRRRFQVNYRNHRKLVVIDRKVAFTGGFNIGDSYHGTEANKKHWFDAHCRVTGPVVLHLHDEFCADWDFAREEKYDSLEENPTWLKSLEKPDQNKAEECGWVQTVSSGPDQSVNRMHAMFFSAIMRANKRVWIASPYFVPDESIYNALRSASLAGVDVRIITQNNKPDQYIPHFAARYYMDHIMKSDVRCFQYQPGMMHAKFMIIDDNIATLGSANCDVRSLALNFELNLIFYSKKEIEEIGKIFLKCQKKSKELGEEFKERNIAIKVVENICRLFGPIL